MILTERVYKFNTLFHDLQNTNSRIDKEIIVSRFLKNYPELQEDWTYILETLANKHPIGWTFAAMQSTPSSKIAPFNTIKEMIQYCETTRKDRNSTVCAERLLDKYGLFLAPIVNRTLRLGIGNSLLSEKDTNPMLAKKFDAKPILQDYFVTEKLDGNRCIARYSNGKWEFLSRAGKKLNVEFDMTGLPTEFMYDGEIMTLEQTKASVLRAEALLYNDKSLLPDIDSKTAQLMFNRASGLINRKYDVKGLGLVYNIFDIITDVPYYKRRATLNSFFGEISDSTDLRIVPTLYTGRDLSIITNLLDTIVDSGGEGVMLNVANANYVHKRTDALLKYKQVKHIDMLVLDLLEGEGKYENMCGALMCVLRREDGSTIQTKVGSGLSDYQRDLWWRNPELIVGKIVQIAYHEVTQAAHEKSLKLYSLRFPRLVKIRNDKIEGSEY